MANKPKIKVGFIDYWKPFDAFMIDWLSKRFDVTRDDISPNYLFFSDETFGIQNQSYMGKATKIFYTGENRRPEKYIAFIRCAISRNKTDFAISFDHFDTKNHYRLPLYVIDYWAMVNKLGMPTFDEMLHKRYNTTGPKMGAKKFCCFISGNGASNKRNDWFHNLNAYKPIDSYGPLFNNVGYVLPRGPEAAKNKLTILPQYKFNLCFENSSYPGYCTEKLFHALYMDTVPIYWGSPTVAMDFDPNSFLSWHEYQNDEKFLEKIKEVDQIFELYLYYYLQPIQNSEYVSMNRYMNPDFFLDWFQHNVFKG